MSLPLAVLLSVLAAVFGNRLLAVMVGLWLRVPGPWLLLLLIALDLVQIPLFYALYDHGKAILERLPARWGQWFQKDWRGSRIGRRAASLGGLGTAIVAAFPMMGGGMWSAVLMAYGLRLRRRSGYFWLTLGSVASYLVTYAVIDTLVSVVRFFSQ